MARELWTEEKLNDLLSQPSDALVEDIKKIKGDIMVLGAGGKMGPSLCLLAKNAIDKAGITSGNYKDHADLVALCDMSEVNFRRLFHKYTGKSPIQHRNDIRLFFSEAREFFC